MAIIPKVPRPRPDLHRVVLGEEADKVCSTMGGFIATECPDCLHKKVIIHCERCAQQMTNCLCTIEEKIHQEQIEEQADIDKTFVGPKLWTPGGSR